MSLSEFLLNLFFLNLGRHNAAHQDIDVAPCLNSFFNALIGELYADPYFRTQLSDVLQLRATADMQQSLLDIVSILKRYDFLSFVTEVLLKREGIEINPQMFVELLKRRCMRLLFDGLDEVATLDERLGLVGEIEHFALCYPGNRVRVTSRPVGYDLARVSHPLFFPAQVQNFNDEQIQQFLENWYTAVLRLSPIPQRDHVQKYSAFPAFVFAVPDHPLHHNLAARFRTYLSISLITPGHGEWWDVGRKAICGKPLQVVHHFGITNPIGVPYMASTIPTPVQLAALPRPAAGNPVSYNPQTSILCAFNAVALQSAWLTLNPIVASSLPPQSF